MGEPSITCPSCGKKIPLTRALRTEIEASVKEEYERRLTDEVERARKQASKETEKKAAQELAALKEELDTQARDLERARQTELALRKRERDLERKQQDLELTIARRLDDERNRVVAETETRLAEQHRLKDLEKERQLADMRRQIDDLKRKANQGSQQLQGEAGEDELESILRATFPWDDVAAVPREFAEQTCIRPSSIHAAAAAERFCGNARTRRTGARAGSRS